MKNMMKTVVSITARIAGWLVGAVVLASALYYLAADWRHFDITATVVFLFVTAVAVSLMWHNARGTWKLVGHFARKIIHRIRRSQQTLKQSIEEESTMTVNRHTQKLFNCVHCGQKLEAPEDMSGESIQCPSCNGSISVPSPVLAVGGIVRTRLPRLAIMVFCCLACIVLGMVVMQTPTQRVKQRTRAAWQAKRDIDYELNKRKMTMKASQYFAERAYCLGNIDRAGVDLMLVTHLSDLVALSHKSNNLFEAMEREFGVVDGALNISAGIGGLAGRVAGGSDPESGELAGRVIGLVIGLKIKNDSDRELANKWLPEYQDWERESALIANRERELARRLSDKYGVEFVLGF